MIRRQALSLHRLPLRGLFYPRLEGHTWSEKSSLTRGSDIVGHFALFLHFRLGRYVTTATSCVA
jgi:hypothetical protein